MRRIVAESIIALAIALTAAWFGYWLAKPSVPTNPGFDKIPTTVNLDKTRWESRYQDVDAQGKQIERTATVEFTQAGSRIIGKGSDTAGNQWIVEGAASDQRVCYIYLDSGGRRLSFGTAILEMNNARAEMAGQWIGWSPELNQLQPRKLVLKKLSN